jgi:hypothetical protein
VQRSTDDFIGDGRAPTFIEAMLRAQPWVKDAACAVEPYCNWKGWMTEPASGRENASTVVRCLEVCRTCPVRRECLDSVLGAEISYYGIYGGTTLTERRAAWTARKLKPDPEFNVRSQWREGVTAIRGIDGASLTAHDRKRIAHEIGDRFEATFEERLELWKERAAEVAAKRAEGKAVTATRPRPARPACLRCGGPLAWFQRSDAAHCSNACRQASYRARTA